MHAESPTSHKSPVEFTGGLVPSVALLGSTIASRLLPEGCVIDMGAVGALGSGFCCVNLGAFCWPPRVGCWGRKVLKRDIAPCSGAAAIDIGSIDQQTTLQESRLRG